MIPSLDQTLMNQVKDIAERAILAIEANQADKLTEGDKELVRKACFYTVGAYKALLDVVSGSTTRLQ